MKPQRSLFLRSRLFTMSSAAQSRRILSATWTRFAARFGSPVTMGASSALSLAMTALLKFTSHRSGS